MADDTAPTADQIAELAKVAGVPIDSEVASRIAKSIGPAFQGFRSVAGTLPFDLEPATFITVQGGART